MGDQGDPNPMWIYKRVSYVTYATTVHLINTQINIKFFQQRLYTPFLVQIMDVYNTTPEFQGALKPSIIQLRVRGIYQPKS